MSIQPLRLLNLQSAQTSSNGSIKWQVRITEGEVTSFTYQQGGQTKRLFAFMCTLVGENPAMYVRGTFKHGNEHTVNDVAKKYKDGEMFLMSKVHLDSKQKSEYLSGPIKHVVVMSPQTKFEPIMQGSVSLAKQPIPAGRMENILRMSEMHDFKGGRYDVAGFVRAGPMRPRTVNTRSGTTKAADFELLQMPERGGQLHAVEVTAWGKHADKLELNKGQFVTLFELEVKVQAPGKVSIETGWSARVMPWAPMDARMTAFANEQMQDSATPANVITSSWTPEAAAGIDTKGDQPLVNTSFLRNCDAGDSKQVTWQINGCFIDIPTASIYESSHTRLWIITYLRDFSGAIEVGLSEPAALAVAGLKTKQEFEEAFNNGSLQFSRCNVRGSRGLREKGEFRYTVVACEVQEDAMPLTKEAENLYNLVNRFGRGTGAVVGTALKDLVYDPFAGLIAGKLTVAKALLLVKGKEKSMMESYQGARKMSTVVECVFAGTEQNSETTVYKVVAFCQEDRLSDYKFDKMVAMVLATSMNKISDDEFEIVAESITIVQKDYVPKVRTCLHTERQLALNMASGGNLKQAASTTWPDSPPNQNKKCRRLEGYPSDTIVNSQVAEVPTPARTA